MKRQKRSVRVVAFSRVELVLPITLVSEMNADDHRMVRHRRKTEQKDEVRSAFWWMPRCPVPAPWVVTITRLSPVDRMDSDNEVSGPKWVRDEVARWLGCDDSKSSPVEWRVDWEKSERVGIRIVVEEKNAK